MRFRRTQLHHHITKKAPLVVSLTSAVLLSRCNDPSPLPEQPPIQKSAVSKDIEQPYYTLEKDVQSTKAPLTKAPPKKTSRVLNYTESLQALRDNGFGKAADVLEYRVAGKERNMDISQKRAVLISTDILEFLPSMEKAQKLLEIMPHSTVELIVSITERGVSVQEAEGIAEFHLAFTKHMQFRKLDQFDRNHSHVIGRDWPEINYTGDGTTWQQRKQDWNKHGVENFQTAANICRYMRAASKKNYFKKAHKPKKSWSKSLDHYCE
ncbi:hypothetical protein KKB44_02145 [Candidatus Micrarchaeota archaeon]|nr:hypothetical protein [Candidatus Micrarchaeota archaeon]